MMTKWDTDERTARPDTAMGLIHPWLWKHGVHVADITREGPEYQCAGIPAAFAKLR